MPLYGEDEPRAGAYRKMVARILELVRDGKKVCAVFYGHPGVLVTPSHEAIHQARQEGYDAVMLPGISTLDCLYADLGIDPRFGFQSFEATDFLVHSREFDPASPIVLWQIDSIGNAAYREAATGPNPGIEVLLEVLTRMYGADHRVVLYRAAQMPLSEPMIHELPLHELSTIPISSATVLYIPPKNACVADEEVMRELGLWSRN